MIKRKSIICPLLKPGRFLLIEDFLFFYRFLGASAPKPPAGDTRAPGPPLFLPIAAKYQYLALYIFE